MRQPNALQQLAAGKKYTHYDDDYFDTLEHVGIREFLAHYQTERNETTFYDYRQSVHYVPTGRSADGVTQNDAQSYIDLEMVI